jgi:hypothetical protein
VGKARLARREQRRRGRRRLLRRVLREVRRRRRRGRRVTVLRRWMMDGVGSGKGEGVVYMCLMLDSSILGRSVFWKHGWQLFYILFDSLNLHN